MKRAIGAIELNVEPFVDLVSVQLEVAQAGGKKERCLIL
jgi:hypothetical protein